MSPFWRIGVAYLASVAVLVGVWLLMGLVAR